MAFGNDVVGGITLVRPAIQSANYVPGVSGWSINRDGSAEFASGTFRGPVIVIDPVTGNVLASIGANGNISGQNVYATGDVIIGSTSVLAALTAAGHGLISRAAITPPLPVVPAASVFVDACWIGFNVPDATRQYMLRSDPLYTNNTNSINGELFSYRWILNQGGVNTTIYTIGVQVDPGSNTIPSFQIMLPALSAAPATLKLQYNNNSASTTYTVYTNNPFNLWIEDVGPRLTAGSGGTGAPSGSQQFTKKYTATVSDTFSGNSPFNRENDASNMYTRTLSGRTNGQETALWVFPGATIRSDITSATIQSARLWMYCTNSSGASGGCNISYQSNTTIPSTRPGLGTDSANFSSSWPVPGWGSIDISGPLVSSIQAGKNSIYLDSAVITGSASFYGAGQAGFEPYIQITYTI